MRRLLILRANPRTGGHTARLTDLFLEGAAAAGARLDDVHLPARRIEHCRGCYHCWLVTPGVCVLRDDMAPLLAEFREADTVVCATPLYHYAMNSHLKKFLERTYPLSKPGFESSPRGLLRAGVRDADDRPRTLVALVTGALRAPRCFQPIADTFALVADAMGMGFGGCLVRPESHMMGFGLVKPKTVKTVQAAFRQAGREAAETGMLTPGTLRQAALPLAPDEAHFLDYSNIYWEHARAMGPAGLDLPAVQERVGRDLRILMREMARSFLPAAAPGDRVLQFDFSDPERHYRLSMAGGTCALSEEQTAAPDLRIVSTTAAWCDFIQGRLDLRDALRAGALRVEGDKALFRRLPRMFPMAAE